MSLSLTYKKKVVKMKLWRKKDSIVNNIFYTNKPMQNSVVASMLQNYKDVYCL